MNWLINGIIYGFIFVGFLIVAVFVDKIGYPYIGNIVAAIGVLVFFIGPNLIRRKTEA